MLVSLVGSAQCAWVGFPCVGKNVCKNGGICKPATMSEPESCICPDTFTGHDCGIGKSKTMIGNKISDRSAKYLYIATAQKVPGGKGGLAPNKIQSITAGALGLYLLILIAASYHGRCTRFVPVNIDCSKLSRQGHTVCAC